MTALRLAVLLGSVLASGCNPVESISEEWNRGTIKGVNICKAAGLREGLTEATVRKICSTRHQKSIPDTLRGRAGYDGYGSNAAFSGSVTNNSDAYIVTEFTVRITHLRAPAGGREHKTFSGVWLEPRGWSPFAFDSNDLSFKPAQDMTNDFIWDTTDVRGIKIDF